MFHEHYLIYSSDTLLLPFNQMSKLKLRGSDNLTGLRQAKPSHRDQLSLWGSVSYAELTCISLQRAYLVQHRNPNKMESLSSYQLTFSFLTWHFLHFPGTRPYKQFSHSLTPGRYQVLWDCRLKDNLHCWTGFDQKSVLLMWNSQKQQFHLCPATYILWEWNIYPKWTESRKVYLFTLHCLFYTLYWV